MSEDIVKKMTEMFETFDSVENKVSPAQFIINAKHYPKPLTKAQTIECLSGKPTWWMILKARCGL